MITENLLNLTSDATKSNAEYPVWNYKAFPEILQNAELGEYCTYSIRMTGPHGSETLHDISANREMVIFLVSLFNSQQLFPVHVLDVLYNLLP